MTWVTKYSRECFECPNFFFKSLYDSYFKVRRTPVQLIESYEIKNEDFEISGILKNLSVLKIKTMLNLKISTQIFIVQFYKSIF